GLSEPLARAIFASDMSAPVSPKPILSRQKVWGFLLLEREHPSREEFEAQKEATRAKLRAEMTPSIVEAYVQNYFATHDPQIRFEPLIKAYGPDTSHRPKGEDAPAGAPEKMPETSKE